MGGVSGIVLNSVPCAIQLACVNSSIHRVENNVGKPVFWRLVNYASRLTSL